METRRLVTFQTDMSFQQDLAMFVKERVRPELCMGWLHSSLCKQRRMALLLKGWKQGNCQCVRQGRTGELLDR